MRVCILDTHPYHASAGDRSNILPMSNLTPVYDFLEQTLEQFCVDFVAGRQAALLRQNAIASSRLVISLDYEVRRQALDEGLTALIAFRESGRFIDMKQARTGRPSTEHIENMRRWLQDKGLMQKAIRDYVRKRRLKTVPERVKTYVAFGVVIKRRNGRHRRKRFYNKAKSAAIAQLYEDVLAGMPDHVFDALKQSLRQ